MAEAPPTGDEPRVILFFRNLLDLFVFELPALIVQIFAASRGVQCSIERFQCAVTEREENGPSLRILQCTEVNCRNVLMRAPYFLAGKSCSSSFRTSSATLIISFSPAEPEQTSVISSLPEQISSNRM